MCFLPQGQPPMFASIDVAGIPRSAPAPDNSVLGIERSYFGTDGKPWSPRPLKEGEALIVRVTVTADTTMPDALLTDLLPAGWRSRTSTWATPSGGPMWWSMASPSATAVKRPIPSTKSSATTAMWPR